MNALRPDRWRQLWRGLGLEGEPLAPYRELVTLCSQPHRHYHNQRHIAECLAEFDSARHLAGQPAAVELAIWFHDAVYDPRASDNEERSAELAGRWISEAGGPATLCDAVAALVMATKAHEASLHSDAPLLVDVDLSILGQPEARFLEYEAQIRLEYDWVPEALFAVKRAEILERFLARDRIYATGLFFSKYEHEARANLHRSLKRLR
jgi:predicted metal-dependent HD superfamily phosphohydrolase